MPRRRKINFHPTLDRLIFSIALKSLKGAIPMDVPKINNIIKTNLNKQVSAAKIVKSANSNLPLYSKLIVDKQIATNTRNKKTLSQADINTDVLKQISQDLYNKSINNKYIIELFPDIELAIQILVSSILSPKKMNGSILNYSFKAELEFEPTLTSDILTFIKTEINKYYKIDDDLPRMLREALFEKGAYITAIIPESSVDEVINSDLIQKYSSESVKLVTQEIIKPKGLLYEGQTLNFYSAENKPLDKTLQDLINDNVFTITDNYEAFKLNDAKRKLTSAYVKSKIKNRKPSMSLEDLNYLDIFRDRNSTMTSSLNNEIPKIKIKKDSYRYSIGRPMFLKLPMEAVIPIFPPNDSTQHIGYFVLVDENGCPISTQSAPTPVVTTTNIIPTDNSKGTTSLTSKAYNNLVAKDTQVDVKELFTNYKSIIENALYEKVKKSIYGIDQSFKDFNDIYYLMFTRAIAGQRTGVVFIPKELVSYIAFDHNTNGTGKTLLNNLSILSSLRAILLFSKIMSYAKSAIDVTTVTVSLDPNDPDPNKTIEMIADQVLKVRQNLVPLFTANPVELADRLQRAGLRFNYENHPGLPITKIDYESTPMQHTVADTDLDDTIRKQMIMGLGLAPEMVDNAFSPEFATSVVANNILLSKRVFLYQSIFTPQLHHLISIIIENDEIIRGKFYKLILKNKDTILRAFKQEAAELSNLDEAEFCDKVITTIINNLEVSLPKPDNTNINNLSNEFNIYKDNLTNFVNSVVSEEIVPEDLAGDLANHIGSIKNVFIHHLLRKWAAENDYYPEALAAIENETPKENELPASIKDIINYLTNLYSLGTGFMANMTRYKEAISKDFENNNIDGQGSSGISSGGSDYDQTGSSDEASSEKEGNAEDYGFSEDEGNDDALKF